MDAVPHEAPLSETEFRKLGTEAGVVYIRSQVSGASLFAKHGEQLAAFRDDPSLHVLTDAEGDALFIAEDLESLVGTALEKGLWLVSLH